MRLLRLACAVAVLLGIGDADAQTYPTRAVRLIVPFPPGGATDVIARLVSQRLHEIWGQPVLLDYKPGAGTIIGTDAVAKAAPDGYTMGMVITAHVLNPSVRPNLPYDTLKDLSGVSMVSVSHIVIVATKSLRANTIPELIALAKKNPGKMNYASPGTGTAMHLAGELLNTMAGINIVHVPYRGGAPSVTDLAAGNLDVMVSNLPECLAQIRGGRLRPLALTSAERHALVPEVPTVRELGMPELEITNWTAVLTQAAVPAPLLARLERDVQTAVQDAETKRKGVEAGFQMLGWDATRSTRFVREETDRWAALVNEAQIKPDA
jgi:tripartite-type tricarboxylate transporter receptor subunit TctC